MLLWKPTCLQWCPWPNNFTPRNIPKRNESICPPKEMYKNVHNSFFFNSQWLEIVQVSIISRTDECIIVQEGMATLSSFLAWRIPWTEEPGRVQPRGSQRVIHDWRDLAHTPMQALKHYTEIKWFILSSTAWMSHTDVMMSEKRQIPKSI